MRKRLGLVVALCGLLTCVSCKKADPSVGSGVQKTETRDLPAFEKLRVGGSASVEVTIGAPCPAEITTDDNLLGAVSTKLEGDVLHVTTAAELRAKVPVRLRLCAPALRQVAAEGAARVQAGKISAERLTVQATGAAKVTLAGSSATLDAKLRTASSLDAAELAIGSATVHADQAASARLGHVEKLSVSIPAAGVVYYRGEPEITREVSKLARVIQER